MLTVISGTGRVPRSGLHREKDSSNHTLFTSDKYVYILACQLYSLPKEIGVMQNLRTLDLEENHLETLPSSFSSLRLLDLTLSINKFKRFPQVLCEMTSLKILMFEENFLSELPHTKLCLDSLSLSRNNITRLKNWVYKSCHFNVLGNPCTITRCTKSTINCDRVAAVVLSGNPKSPSNLYTCPIEGINLQHAHTKIKTLL